MSETNGPLPRSEFWMRIAGAAFGLWALMIPLGVSMLREAFTTSTAASDNLARQVNESTAQMQSRIAVLEARQSLALIQLEALTRKVDEMRDHK